jgi:hypothetical protein
MKYKSIILLLVLAVFLVAVLATASAWDGDVTEGAADSLMGDSSEGERQILPWKIEGDLLLFFFLAGGATAGFAAGYYWRKFFVEPGPEDQGAVVGDEETV